MLTYHLRDESGALAYYRDRPLTITVSPRWARPSRLSDGATIKIDPASVAPEGPSEAELDELMDHVHGWSGFTNREKLIPCTRNWLRGCLISRGWFLAEVRRAIDLASSAGVLV